MQVSNEALAVYRASDVIDLHIDTFIWNRLFGYDLTKHHSKIFGGNLLGHVDFPRIRESGMTGSSWIITTNPFKSARAQADALRANIPKLEALLKNESDFSIAKTVGDYQKIRAQGKHAAFIGIQGGSCFVYDLNLVNEIPKDLIIRVTILHLMNSKIGQTSTPDLFGRSRKGLTTLGRDLVRELNGQKIMVDLAHISRAGFFDAVEVHDKSQPLIVTHTGVSGVFPHWRNLDDEQVKAIANTGGTIGIMLQSAFLAKHKQDQTVAKVIDHMEHIIKVAGEDFVSIGTDFDGVIVPPKGLESPLGFPLLVQEMLKRSWSAERIGKILGGNFLRTLKHLRG